jgi:enoyl-CoA hydratase/carnithine racemase
VEAGIAEVTLDRPERHNALGSRIVGELGEALEEIEGSGPWYSPARETRPSAGEIVLACDFRIAAEGARFALPEVGIVPGAGGTQRLPRLIGVTKELILTGRRIGAEEALDMGLVSKVIPRSSLMEEARSLAQEIAANSPLPRGAEVLDHQASAFLATPITALVSCRYSSGWHTGQ